jgi:thioester reductase-like protein
VSAETDIAVVGVGCRFPDARTPEEFWSNLDSGRVSTREQPLERLRAAGLTDALLCDPSFVRVAATVPDVEQFASDFFDYQPAEADLIDPSQRLFLEVCWEALESAGHPPSPDGPVVGVFASGGPSPYSQILQVERIRGSGLAGAVGDLDLTIAGSVDFIAARVAYKLGLRGPSVAVQTACSSSVTAVHYAVLSLLSGECQLAVAGGAAISDPMVGYQYTTGGIMSHDGYCRPFDARSTGTGAGAGVGALVLRRLADALADGDAILAVVRGSAVGNDGAARSGFTAPSPSGISQVVAAALRAAGVRPDRLRYVEAHGSGTVLGDAIELRGLAMGLRAAATAQGIGALPTRYCALGSVKANIGHAGWAAGIAGCIKAVHIASSGTVVPLPLFEHPRDSGVLADSPFFVPTVASSLSRDDEWCVLVNSIGLGGTNACLVMSPPPAPTRPSSSVDGTVRLVLSARTRGELDAVSRKLAQVIEEGTIPIADIAHTLRVGRRSFEERRVVAAPAERLAAALRLPRRPDARTERPHPRRPLLVVDDGPAAATGELLGLLGRVFRGGAEVASGPLRSVPADRFPLFIGHGEPGPDGHVLPLGPLGDVAPDELDEAVTAAWLGGVEVDWEVLAAGQGRRARLPTYPYRRRRHWALDRIGLPSLRSSAAPDGRPLQAGHHQQQGDPSGDPVRERLQLLWRELFGVAAIGPDDEFGSLGGTSMLSVQMALEIRQRFGVLINLHRAGGSRMTVRRLTEIIHASRASQRSAAPAMEEASDGDGRLIDADLAISLRERRPVRAGGGDVLLTGASGFLGAFLLQQLLEQAVGRVYCLVRADDEADGLRKLRAAAASYDLPEPADDRVQVIPGDLRDAARICEAFRGGELAQRVGHVLHCAARVVFTEPYRVLRSDNVLPLVGLLHWMRRHGIGDLSFVSSLAAAGPALEAGGQIVETRAQPLDPGQGGYGSSKWVAERILERAERDGLRVRIFRPGLILGSLASGACNARDLVWRMLASGLAVGAHPLDERVMSMAPVDVVSGAIVGLALRPGSAGLAYHLVDEVGISVRRLFGLLAEAGLPTRPLPRDQWMQVVAERALVSGNQVLASMALYEREGHDLGAGEVQAQAWRPWLKGAGCDPRPSGQLLRDCLSHLARKDPAFRDLLAGPGVPAAAGGARPAGLDVNLRVHPQGQERP